jgi:hypothetical protein
MGKEGSMHGRENSGTLGEDEDEFIEIGCEDVDWIHLAQDGTSCGLL